MRRMLLHGPRGVNLRCDVPERRRERARGLLRRQEIASDEAMLFSHATSVHTFGMRFAILVVRLDPSFRVVDARLVAPQRFVPPMRVARHVLECHPDVGLRTGDRLEIRSVRRSRPVRSSL
ncbi:MAG: DUF192 domain-containing protein [Actinomycetota bacterium]